MIQAESRSWVAGADRSGYSLAHLPYGVARPPGAPPRPVVRIGDQVLDLAAIAGAGLLNAAEVPPEVFAAETLNPLIEEGRPAWERVRARLRELLDFDNTEIRDQPRLAEAALRPLEVVEMVMPIEIGDYVDGYASLEHATNLGRLFRPGQEPLPANWRHVPIAYHGRAGTVVVTGTPIRRPLGQRAPQPPDSRPTFGPERRLDIELELGFVTGAGPSLGVPVAPQRVADHIFGAVLVNDWSAREIQRWEYQPLGPFLGKSFATSISAWITPLSALEQLRVPGPPQDPPPLEYLQIQEPWALNLDLEISLRAAGEAGETIISRGNAKGLYWSIAQQLVHATVNGATIRAGDLFASGTISGASAGSYGSLVELSRGGQEPIALDSGTTRTFLEDGDAVVLRATGTTNGVTIALGEVEGVILPARPVD